MQNFGRKMQNLERKSKDSENDDYEIIVCEYSANSEQGQILLVTGVTTGTVQYALRDYK
jgi:hypothetical protein